MRSRARRWAVWGGAGIGALLFLGVFGVALATGYLRASLPETHGTAVHPALQQEVVITRDARGVPSIAAADLCDVFFALGYVHAQDRRWQMDLARRVAQGRLAQAFGAELVDADRLLRAVGLWRAAGRADSALTGEMRALMQAYADGVNAWSVRGRRRPPEFVILGIEPEPWTIQHSLAVAKLMTWDLTEWDLTLSLARAADQVGPELARELGPRVPEWAPRIIPRGAQGARAANEAPPAGMRERKITQAPAGVSALLPEVPARLRALLEGYGIARASNSWVIGPSRTRSGKPILANDMHLPMRAPPVWYLAGLHGPDFDVVGMTLPGVPAVVAGHNRWVSWGYSAAMVDNVDFFVEEVDPADRTRYRTPDGWGAMTFRDETIAVRGQAEPIFVRVAETRHGPVLPSSATGLGDRVVAMAWTGAWPTLEARAILRLNRARNFAEVVDALREFGNPGVNVLFADADGNIGYWLAGSVPVRRSGDGVWPVPGATGEGDWVGTVPFESLPHVLNPAAGYLVTANNIPQDGGPFIGAHFMGAYRAARIAQLIEATPAHDALSVHAMQLDVWSLFADRHVPTAVRAAREAGEPEVADRLAGWDRQARPESRAAAIFYTWFEQLRREIAADEYGGSLGYFPWETLDHILASGQSRWIDDRRTPEVEDLSALAARAMKEAVSLAGHRTWGEIHPLTNEHALGSLRWLDTWLGMNVGPFQVGGDPFTVNAAYHVAVAPGGLAGRADPEASFRVAWGASQRHVVDLGDLDGAGGFILPTGQSGHPLSPHYQDQVEAWRFGGLGSIPLDRGRARAAARSEWVLAPARKTP